MFLSSRGYTLGYCLVARLVTLAQAGENGPDILDRDRCGLDIGQRCETNYDGHSLSE